MASPILVATVIFRLMSGDITLATVVIPSMDKCDEMAAEVMLDNAQLLPEVAEVGWGCGPVQMAGAGEPNAFPAHPPVNTPPPAEGPKANPSPSATPAPKHNPGRDEA